MTLRYALLSLLAEGGGHGYVLLKRFNDELGPLWQPNTGQVYQVLEDLARRGLAAAQEEHGGAHRRRVFCITAKGQRALSTWLSRRPAWPRPVREELLVRLLAAAPAGPRSMLAQIERQEAEYHRYLDLVAEEGRLARGGHLVRRLAADAARCQVGAYLEWLARCRRAVVAPAPTAVRAIAVQSVVL